MQTNAERRLAWIAATGALALLIAAGLLWIRYGQSIYISRVLAEIADCL
jgi:hypothetical protein